MKRFWPSIIILLAAIVSFIYLTGMPILAFFDIPSLIIAIVIPFLFVTILFGFKKTHRAFSIIRKDTNEQATLQTALVFFRVYGKATWIAAFIAAFIGSIGIFYYLDEPAAVGPNFALILIALIYCGIVQMTVVLPYTVLIHKQLGDSRIKNDVLSLFGSLFGVLIVYLIFLVIVAPM